MKPIPLTQYDLQGNLIATYNGLREAERLTGLKAGTIADHVTSGKPLDGYMWQAPCHRQTKAERRQRDKRRAEMRLREALAINPYKDATNLLFLVPEPLRGKIGQLMKDAIDNGGSPREAFCRWYIHQNAVDIPSDSIVDALYPNNRPDRQQ